MNHFLKATLGCVIILILQAQSQDQSAFASVADKKDLEKDSSHKMLKLNLRSQVAVKSDKKEKSYKSVSKTIQIDPKKTALIICDMWDDHWCQGAARRVNEMAGPMNQVVNKARQMGIFIIHAPSSTVDYYKKTPQRKLATSAPFAKSPVRLSTRQRWGTAWCWPDVKREPNMPIDDSDMGCDCNKKCKIREAWSKQIKTIEIKKGDAISHDSQEVYNMLEQRKIDNIIIMGVHLNMCVLGRPFGIRQMVQVGKKVILVRDMTDTMYNSQKKPYVNHFRGTDLVVRHVERHWCPTMTSVDIVGGKAFCFKEDPRKKSRQ